MYFPIRTGRSVVAADNRYRKYPFIVMFFVFVVSALCGACGGITTVGPSRTVGVPVVTPSFSAASAPSAPLAPLLFAPLPSTQTISGTVFPLGQSAPCFLERYPCQIYEFAMPQEGSIGVTLNWDGQPRAMLVQLYWGDGLLAHEDVAPRSGPSQIAFRRGLMEPNTYRVRVVSLEPDHAMPFILTLSLTTP